MQKILIIKQQFLFKHQLMDLQYKDECKLHKHESLIELAVSNQINSDYNAALLTIDWAEPVLVKILESVIDPINNKHIISDKFDSSKNKYIIKPYILTSHTNILEYIFNKLKEHITCHYEVSLILNSKIKYCISTR
jgi:hypothetical protein